MAYVGFKSLNRIIVADKSIKNKIISNKELAKELHRPIIRKSKKSTHISYGQYLGCWSWRYAIDK